MTRARLLAEISDHTARIERPHPVRIGIDGVDAAGKTTLADELGDELARRMRAQGRPVIRASIDHFFNPSSIRKRRGPLSPEGFYRDSFNLGELIAVLLSPLGPGGTRRYRTAIFDLRNDQVVDSAIVVAPSNAVLVFDGVFLHRPELCGHWDFSIFLRVDFATALKRAMVRDSWIGSAEAVEHRYRTRYLPGQQLYFDECGPERVADLVIDNNDPANPAIIRSGSGS